MGSGYLADRLEYYHDLYNRPRFVEDDPVSIPHRFSLRQDVEIMGLFAAVLAWGQRKTIVSKCLELAAMMELSPYDFVQHHKAADLKPLTSFRHRTFNGTDLLYFIDFLKRFYSRHSSLESAFLPPGKEEVWNAQNALIRFQDRFFEGRAFPERTRKHIASPERRSACKRLNMYLRWMVRKDDRGVDLGLWKAIPASALMCPLDVHVERSARRLGLLTRRQRDWAAVEELTSNLRSFDPEDPVRYDFALFGMSLENVSFN